MTRRAAVIGDPVLHSLSPVMHRAAYAALGLAGWEYQAIEVPQGGLGDFIDTIDETWAGVSVTMPHKRDVRAYLAQQSELAQQVGAVNTLVVRKGATGVELIGDNTDVYGIAQALTEASGGPPDAVKAFSEGLILGGGATAASAVAALRDLGCSTPLVLARAPERAGEVAAAAQRLGVHVRIERLDADSVRTAIGQLDARGAVVSALPAGAADHLAEATTDGLRLSLRHGVASAAPGGPTLLDVVYHPWPTILASAWADLSPRVAGGLSMLVHQAVGQVRLMTGRRPPLSVMREAGQRQLDARRNAARSPQA